MTKFYSTETVIDNVSIYPGPLQRVGCDVKSIFLNDVKLVLIQFFVS